MARPSVISVLPQKDYFLAIAKGFDPSNVNLPRGPQKRFEDPLEAASRVLYEQTRVILKVARLLPVGVPDTFVYFVTEFSGRPLPTQLGRAHWARADALLQLDSEDRELATRILEKLDRFSRPAPTLQLEQQPQPPLRRAP